MNNGILAYPKGGMVSTSTSRRPRVGAATLNRSHVLANGLIGAWLFNEGSGTSLTNLAPTGSSYNGALSGSTSWTIDENGDPVLSLSGGLATITGYGNIAPTDEVTYVLSAYQTALTDQCATSINNGSSTNRQSILLAHSGSGGNQFWDNGSASGSGRLSYTPSSTLNSWINWAFLSSASIPLMAAWRNGALAASQASRDAFTRTNVPLLIGSGSTGTWLGRWRYLYIYERTLAVHEIQALNTNPYQHFNTT